MKPRSPIFVLLIAYITYVLFGMFTGGLGPVLGELSRQTGSPLAAIGAVLTCLFLGSLVAQIVSGPLTDRFGQKPVFVASLLALSLGILGFTSAHTLAWMLLLALVTGLGQGGLDMGANLVVTDAAPKNSTSALNLLHFFFGLGAFIGPALVALAIGSFGSGLAVHRGVAALFFVSAIAAAVLLENRAAPNAAADAPLQTASKKVNVYLSPLLWLMGAMLLVYVGVEFGLGSWISSYMKTTTAMSAENGAWVTSAYWAALAIGRLAGAAASHKLTPIQLLMAGLTGSLLGAIGLFAAHTLVVPTVLCVVWISFSFANVYPTTVAVAADAFPRDQGKAVSVLVAMGNIGGSALPWVAGLLLAGAASFGYLWFVTLCIALLLLLVSNLGRTLSRQTRSAVT